MMYIVGIAAVVLLPVLWSVLLHPLRSAATALKVGLGLAGMLYVLIGVLTGDLGYGLLGGLLLICVFVFSFFQARLSA